MLIQYTDLTQPHSSACFNTGLRLQPFFIVVIILLCLGVNYDTKQ